MKVNFQSIILSPLFAILLASPLVSCTSGKQASRQKLPAKAPAQSPEPVTEPGQEESTLDETGQPPAEPKDLGTNLPKKDPLTVNLDNAEAKYRWQKPFTVGQNEGLDILAFRLASLESGKSLLVWRQDNNPDANGTATGHHLVATYSFDGIKWTAPLRADQNQKSDTQFFEVALDQSGAGFLVWAEQEGNAFKIYGSFFDDTDQSWSTPFVAVENGSQHFSVAATSKGKEFLLAWSQKVANQEKVEIYARHFLVSEGNQPSTTASLVASAPNSHMLCPVIKISDAGKGAIVWKKNDMTSGAAIYHSVWVSFLNQGVFSTPVEVSSAGSHASVDQSDGGFGTTFPDYSVAISKAGLTLITWDISQVAINSIPAGGVRPQHVWAAAFDQDNQKILHTKLSDAENKSAYPVVAFNQDGNAIIVWQLTNEQNQQQAISSYFDGNTKKFAPAVAVLEQKAGNTWYPNLMTMASGDFLLAFTRRESASSKYQVTSSQFNKDTRKFLPQNVMDGASNLNDASFPILYHVSKGRIGVVWRQAMPRDSQKPEIVHDLLAAFFLKL